MRLKKYSINEKFERLKAIVSGLGSVFVAYSGGTDSTLLLRVARDELGKKVLAVIASSLTYPGIEIKKAVGIAKKMGVTCRVITTKEIENPKFCSNPVNRCYYCKKELFSRLVKIAGAEKLHCVVDGSNLDDEKDFRPGNKAKKELGVRSPLKEAGLTKKDIRILSRKMGLPTWDKPSLACLASRFPYGVKINKSDLNKIGKAESFLHGLGFRQVRIRHYGDTARIEVDTGEIKKLIAYRLSLIAKLKKLGYKYITLDLEGYRTGSMNEILKNSK